MCLGRAPFQLLISPEVCPGRSRSLVDRVGAPVTPISRVRPRGLMAKALDFGSRESPSLEIPGSTPGVVDSFCFFPACLTTYNSFLPLRGFATVN
ncbi:hypothetical protein V8C26DRAFT_300600 [Trichoderma gracile]